MKEKLKTIKTIHIALCIGVSAVYYILGDIHTLDFLKIPKIDSTTLVYLLIPVSAVFTGNFLYKKQLSQVDTSLTLEEKMGTYQTASIIRWAMIEGGAFIILFLKKELIIIGLLLILYLAILKPSEEAMKRDFNRVKS